jgi:hypothetical protein
MTFEYMCKEEVRHFWQVQNRAALAVAEDPTKMTRQQAKLLAPTKKREDAKLV